VIGWIGGQLLSQLGWTLALAAAPFLALERGRPGEVAAGVFLAQLLRLLPLVAGAAVRRPGATLIGAHLAATLLVLLAALGGWPLLAYGAAGGVGVLEGWLGPVALRARLSGPAFDRANGLLTAVGVAAPALAWPPAGWAVAALGPARVLAAAAGLFALRALALWPWRGLSGGSGGGAAPRRDGARYGVPLFFLLLPVGWLATRLPALLGPGGYAVYNLAFALGTAAGGLLAGRGRLGLPGGGALLLAGTLALLGRSYLPGAALYGLGLGAAQVAGLGRLARVFGAGELAGVLARVAALGALGGAAGAFLSGAGWALASPLLGLVLGAVILRWERRP